MRNLTGKLFASALLCAAAGAAAGDWPQHRGPGRHGTTLEPHLLEAHRPGGARRTRPTLAD